LVSALNDNWNNDRRLNVNGNNFDNFGSGLAFGIALSRFIFIKMKSHKNIYKKVYSKKNLILAWRKARKNKTKKEYVINFEDNLLENINNLHYELKNQTYFPRYLENFIIRDPKTRKISKSHFRDRVIHHAICNIIEPIFDKTFIYDNCANRKGKGNLFTINRFYLFLQKVSRNGKINGWFNENQVKGYCFKADIKHYFQNVDHEILQNILNKKIKDAQVIWLIKVILERERERERITVF